MITLTDEMPCEPKSLCMRPLLRRTYGLFWDHAVLLISAHLALILILLIGNQLLTVGGHILVGPFLLGYFKIALRLARNQNTELADLLSGFEFFLPAFVANILIHILAAIGFGLLIVPGFLVLITYATTFFFILEKNLGFWDAMEASRRMVWGNFRRWLLVGLAIIAANLIGVLCCFVGLLVTMPFGLLLTTLAYDEELNDARRREEEKNLLGGPPPMPAPRDGLKD